VSHIDNNGEGNDDHEGDDDDTSVGDQSPRKNSGSHIDASHSRQPLVKGERLVRYEVNAVMTNSQNYQDPMQFQCAEG
jgi:hypothetical protein